MNYKILSPSKYKDNMEILINYKQLKFYYLQANRKQKIENITLYGSPSKNNIVWSTKYNIGDNIFEISEQILYD